MEWLYNPVLLAVLVLLILSALRMNVVFSLIVSSIVGGLLGFLPMEEFWNLLSSGEFRVAYDLVNGSFSRTMSTFTSQLDNGATLAINYVMLGTFSIAISKSGVTELIARWIFKWLNCNLTESRLMWVKYLLLLFLGLIAISSQNLIPMHIAFIPVLVPPLLGVFNKLQLDRRAVACVLTFGLITPYMVIPMGFGKIYLNNILIDNINRNGMEVSASQTTKAMLIPAIGMVVGVLIALFVSYKKKRVYDEEITNMTLQKVEPEEIKVKNVVVGIIAIVVAFFIQIFLDSLLLGALLAVMVFVVSKVLKMRDTQDVFTEGVHLMGGIGIVMIAAAGFANVMKETGGVTDLVNMVSSLAQNYKGIAIFLMLLIGLIITMGIGSSFSTVPLIAAIYTPLCLTMGLSGLATIAIIGSAGALGDAGSPVSESVLGPTAGLNADGQHEHIYDSVIPTFLHFNLPLLIAGWIAGMVL